MKLRLLVMASLLVAAVGCKTSRSAQVVTWPEVDALPASAPADLERQAPTSLLRRGSDGFVYIVGGVSDDVDSGARFLARYAGDWPLEDLPRPPLASGRLIRRIDDDVALVGLDYMLPDTDIEGLEVTWETAKTSEEVGKGVGRVTVLRPTEKSDLKLDVSQEHGVQPGDVYAILRPVDGDVDEARQLQMARRLVGICLVDTADADGSTCRLWRGSSMLPGAGAIAVGQQALFLEHTFGRKPSPAVIQIASVEGTDDPEALHATLRKAFEGFVGSMSAPNTTVEPVALTTDATSIDFHRNEKQVEYAGKAQILVGTSVREVGGKPHLIGNYTGVGPATGPGMVAAPPEGGIDLGPIEALDPDRLRSFAATVFAAVQVYRGQTSEAMMHLQQLLGDPRLDGELRWHARDQFAMRWAALGRVEQALWLVLEDEAVARQRNDQQAYLNALGTRVRLYDMLELPERALEAAAEYLDGRERDRPNSAYLSAVGMHAEMLMAAEKIEQAREQVEHLIELCPEGCDSELSMLLSGVYWAVPPDNPELQDELLEKIMASTQVKSGPRLAAVRIYQGLSALRDDRLEDALIAFLEGERLYSEAGYLQGVARAKYFIFLTQISRQELQKAFGAAVEVAELYQQLGDFEGAARTYERLASLYANFDPSSEPGAYLGAAQEVLGAAVRSQLARGDYGRASEAFFSLGTFLLKIGQLAESTSSFQRAVLFAIRSTRFDVAAMSHLSLGVIARHQNNRETFMDEINRARVMGEISDDPSVMEAIERVLSPPEEESDVPTQLL